MNQSAVENQSEFVLPPSVVSKLDLSHLVSEAEEIDSYLTSAMAKAKVGAPVEAQPTLSDKLTDFCVTNRIQFGDGQQRVRLIKRLRHLKDNAPVVHMTFATAADTEDLQQLANWLRRSVSPQAVISVGLQPDLIGGVYLRTTNHVFDLSVRAQLAGKRHLLVEAVEALGGKL